MYTLHNLLVYIYFLKLARYFSVNFFLQYKQLLRVHAKRVHA